MKKLILFLAILSGVHFVNAQTSTTRGSASINLQKVEQEQVQELPQQDTIVNDSVALQVMNTETDLAHNKNKKNLTELEFDSWNMYYAMMANDNMQYNASVSELDNRKRVSRKYAKAAYPLNPK